VDLDVVVLVDTPVVTDVKEDVEVLALEELVPELVDVVVLVVVEVNDEEVAVLELEALERELSVVLVVVEVEVSNDVEEEELVELSLEVLVEVVLEVLLLMLEEVELEVDVVASRASKHKFILATAPPLLNVTMSA